METLFVSGVDKVAMKAVLGPTVELTETDEGGLAALVSCSAGFEQKAVIRKGSSHGLDVNPIPHRWGIKSPKLIVFDMDSTLIKQEGIDVLADAAGQADQVRHLTEQAMQGELSFREALQERVACLKGLSRNHVIAASRHLTLREGSRALIEMAHAHHGVVACASGGFDLMIKPIMQHLGMNYYCANQLEFDADDLCTGRVCEPIVDEQYKASFMMNLCEQLSISPKDVVVVADGANDIEMMRQAGLGIGIHPKPKLASEADMIFRHSPLCVLSVVFGWS